MSQTGGICRQCIEICYSVVIFSTKGKFQRKKILQFTEFSSSISSNAGNPFNRFDQQEIIQALRLIPWGFCVSGGSNTKR